MPVLKVLKNGVWEEVGSYIGTDKTLTQNNIPADAKVVGDSLSELTDKFDDYYLKSEANTLHTEIKDYVDTEVAALVNSAPETLDTLGELAAAFKENQDMVDTLDAAITTKANISDVETIQQDIFSIKSKFLSDSLVISDVITGDLYKIQIQNGQLVTFSLKEGV